MLTIRMVTVVTVVTNTGIMANTAPTPTTHMIMMTTAPTTTATMAPAPTMATVIRTR